MTEVVPTWVITLATEGTIDAIDVVRCAYRTRCQSLVDGDGHWTLAKEREEAEVISRQLDAAHEILTQGSAQHIDAWQKLVRSGLTLVRAEEAVMLIHSDPA